MKSFSYRPRVGALAWAGGLFAVACVYFVQRAATNSRGVTINGLIELGVDGATRFYAGLALFSAGIVALAVAATVAGLLRKPQLLIHDDHLVVPVGLFAARHRVVKFSDVRRITEHDVHGQQLLSLSGDHGAISLLRSQFASAAEYGEAAAILRARVGAQ